MSSIEGLEDVGRACSHSSMMCGKGCERCWFYRYRCGLVRKREPFKVAARLGSLYHWLLQVGPRGERLVRNAVAERQMKLMEQIEAGEDLTGELAKTANGMTEVFNKALAMARIFWAKYPVPDFIETIGTEQKIEKEVEVGDFTLPIEGTVDKIVRNTKTGNIWIRDAKTTSRDVQYMLVGYEFSVQCRFYRWLTDEWLRDNDVGSDKLAGFLLDVSSVPGIKLCGKDEKTAAKEDITPLEAYIKRVNEWYTEKGKDAMVSKGILFTESLFSDEFMRDLHFMQDLHTRELSPGVYNRDSTLAYCKRYERICDYYELCSSDESTWPHLIEIGYEIKEK